MMITLFDIRLDDTDLTFNFFFSTNSNFLVSYTK